MIAVITTGGELLGLFTCQVDAQDRSMLGKFPNFLRKYFSKSVSFGLCVLRARQVGSVVVLNTCLCVVLLSNAREGVGARSPK